MRILIFLTKFRADFVLFLDTIFDRTLDISV